MTRRILQPNLLSGRMNRRRLLGTSALAAASATTLGSFRSPAVFAQDAVEVTWTSWGNTGEVENLKNFTDDFNNSQTAVKAKYNPIPTDGYDAKLLTQLSGGTAPDLFYAGDGQVSTYVKNAVVMDLTDLLSGATSKSKPEDFAGDLWGPSKTAEGRLFGVPVDCSGTTRNCSRRPVSLSCQPMSTRPAAGPGMPSRECSTN
jgi:multiple sugar transport system substrate-binding protein